MKARLAEIFRERRNLYLLALWLSILRMDQATKALVKNLMSVHGERSRPGYNE